MRPHLLRERDGSEFVIDPPSPATYDALPLFTEAVALSRAAGGLRVFVRIPANLRASLGPNSKPHKLSEEWKRLRDSGCRMDHGQLLRDHANNQKDRAASLNRLPAIEVLDSSAWQEFKEVAQSSYLCDAVALAERWARYMQHGLGKRGRLEQVYFPALYWADATDEMKLQRERVLKILGDHWKQRKHVRALTKLV